MSEATPRGGVPVAHLVIDGKKIRLQGRQVFVALGVARDGGRINDPECASAEYHFGAGGKIDPVYPMRTPRIRAPQPALEGAAARPLEDGAPPPELPVHPLGPLVASPGR